MALINENEIVGGGVIGKPPNPFAAASLESLRFVQAVDVKGNGMTDAADHGDGVQIGETRGAVTEDQRPVRCDDLRHGIADQAKKVDGFCFFGLDGDGRKRSFVAVRGSEDRRYGQVLARPIVAKLQFGAPADLGGPIG